MAFLVRWRNIPRKVHVTRILGTNKDGDVLPDMWVDVERFDNFTNHQKLLGGMFQKLIAHFIWNDDPEDTNVTYIPEDFKPDGHNNYARYLITRKICSPEEEDYEDPEEWVPVKTFKRLRLLKGGEAGMVVKNLAEKMLSLARKVEYRRIYHYDTNIDEKAEKIFEKKTINGEDRKTYVVKGYEYDKDTETKDEDQYIEVEVITSIMTRGNAHVRFQKSFLNLKNQYLVDESEKAKLEQDERGENDVNPPYRLDPYQNIINVSLGGLAVRFGPKDKDAKDEVEDEV